MLYSSVQVMEVHLRGLSGRVSLQSDLCLSLPVHKEETEKPGLSGTGSIFDKILICSPSRGPDGHVGAQVVTGMLISPREAVNVFYQNKSLLVGAAEGHLPKEARRSRPPVSHHREPGR